MAFGGTDDASSGGQGAALGNGDKAARSGGGQPRATFPRTWEEVVAEEQPGTCPEACLRQSLQLAPRPREAGWEAGWAAGWEAGWEVSWEVAGEVAQAVLLALQLLAKARATRAQHPPLRQLQPLAPTPRVFQLLQLLAPPPRVFQALQLAAKVPVRQEKTQQLNPPQTTQRLSPMQTTQRLQPPPRVVVHGRAGEGCHTYLLGI